MLRLQSVLFKSLGYKQCSVTLERSLYTYSAGVLQQSTVSASNGLLLTEDCQKHSQRSCVLTPGTTLWVRHMTSRVKAGVPAPRPGMEHVMSTYKGGHIMRLIKYAESLEELDDVMWDARKKVEAIHIGMCAMKVGALHKSGKVDHNQLMSARLCATLEALTVDRARTSFSAWTTGNVLKGLSKAGFNMKDESLQLLAEVLLDGEAVRLRMCADVDHVNIAWGFAWQEYRDPQLWDALATHMTPVVKNYRLSHLVPVLYAYAQVGHQHPALFEAVTAAIGARAPEMTPMFMSTVTASLSRLRLNQSPLLTSVLDQALSRLPSFRPSEISQLLLALRDEPPGGTRELFVAAADVVVSQVNDFTPWEVAKTISAFNITKNDNKLVYEALAQRAADLIASKEPLMKPAHLSHLAHSLSYLGNGYRAVAAPLLDSIVATALPQVSTYPRDVQLELLGSLERFKHPQMNTLKKALQR